MVPPTTGFTGPRPLSTACLIDRAVYQTRTKVGLVTDGKHPIRLQLLERTENGKDMGGEQSNVSSETIDGEEDKRCFTYVNLLLLVSKALAQSRCVFHDCQGVDNH